MSYTWWAVRGSIDEVFDFVLTPAGYFRDPRWVSRYDLDEDLVGCVSIGEWTILLGITRALDLTAFAEVLRLEKNDYESAIIESHGTTRWSVRGSYDDDRVKPRGYVPQGPEIDELLQQEHDCDELPVRIGALLTGFDVSEYESPAIRRLWRIGREPFEIELDDVEVPQFELSARDETGLAFDLVADGVEIVGWQVVARGEERILLRADETCVSVDISSFPPRFTAIAGEIGSAAFAPWGGELVAIDLDDSLVREVDGATTSYLGLPFANMQMFDGLRAVAGGVVALPTTWSDGDRVPFLITAEGDERSMIRIDVPPLVKVSEEDGATDEPSEATSALVAPFGDGSFLLVWKRTTYRWYRGALETLAPLEIEDYVTDGAATAADGSLLLITRSGLVQLWPDGRRRDIPSFDSPTRICAGLDGTFVVMDCDSCDAKILWLDERRITRVGEIEDDEDDEDVSDEDLDIDICYADERNRLLVLVSSNRLIGIPWAAIAAMPRTQTG